MLNTLKQALDSGWKPKVDNSPDVRIKHNANITWLPQQDIYIIPSDKGVIQLDKEDLMLAKTYLKENYGKK